MLALALLIAIAPPVAPAPVGVPSAAPDFSAYYDEPQAVEFTVKVVQGVGCVATVSYVATAKPGLDVPPVTPPWLEAVIVDCNVASWLIEHGQLLDDSKRRGFKPAKHTGAEKTPVTKAPVTEKPAVKTEVKP